MLTGLVVEEWFHTDTNVLACVQDTVHIATKLKSRLLKPSSLLPMGKYITGVQHLRMIQATFGKDVHGLRERDINPKDKQNFQAVLAQPAWVARFTNIWYSTIP